MRQQAMSTAVNTATVQDIQQLASVTRIASSVKTAVAILLIYVLKVDHTSSFSLSLYSKTCRTNSKMNSADCPC